MSDLCRLQNQFQQYLLQEERAIQDAIVPCEKVPVSQRLYIYLDAYRCRLCESLINNFPMLHAYLGSDAFRQLAADYIDHYPSNFRSIRWFGDHFADYLTINYDPYLAELAEFEWKMTLAFDAADKESLTIERMATVPPESWPTLCFIPHPSLQRMNFSWNSVAIWQAITDEKKAPKPIKNTADQSWILWRKDYINHFYTLAADEAWAIDGLIKGLNFGELCAGLCEWQDEQDVAMRAASLLKNWIQSGLFVEIK